MSRTNTSGLRRGTVCAPDRSLAACPSASLGPANAGRRPDLPTSRAGARWRQTGAPASTSNERLLCVQSSLRPGRRPLSPVTSAGSGHGTKAPRNARLGGGLRRFRRPEARARAVGRACPSAGAECPQGPGCPSARAPGRRRLTILDSRTHPDPALTFALPVCRSGSHVPLHKHVSRQTGGPPTRV